MPATDSNLGALDPVPGPASAAECATDYIERICGEAVNGRRAARALAEWSKTFGLSEAEFQLLWRLRSASRHGPDQTALAGALAYSPAQISGTVERLRIQGWISAHTVTGDRRRHQWQLSESGRELLDRMLRAAASLCCEPVIETESTSNASPGREAAA